jgi:hypothetical protein
VQSEHQEEEEEEEPKVEQLREAELVRDRLAALDEQGRSLPEGHNMRVIIEELHLERALRAVGAIAYFVYGQKRTFLEGARVKLGR